MFRKAYVTSVAFMPLWSYTTHLSIVPADYMQSLVRDCRCYARIRNAAAGVHKLYIVRLEDIILIEPTLKGTSEKV